MGTAPRRRRRRDEETRTGTRDWSDSTSHRTYTLQHRTHRGLGRRLSRSIPVIVILVVAALVWSRHQSVSEERLWEACRAAYEAGDVTHLDLFERFLSLYPDSEHAEEVRYDFASLAHDVRGCEAVVPMWERLLDSDDLERRTEAALRLGDCAAESGQTQQAIDYYHQATAIGPTTPWAAEAALKLGDLYRDEGDLRAAAAAYDSLRSYPATTSQIVAASREIGRLYLDRLHRTQGEHIVRKGETLWRIASRYGLSLQELRRANPWLSNPDRLSVGDRLTIPLQQFSLLIDRESAFLYLFYEDAAVRPYPIVVGAEDAPTPLGTFRVSEIVSDGDRLRAVAESVVGLNVLGVGTRWIGLQGASFGIHGGAPVERLLTRNTRGTIQMTNDDIEELSAVLSKGATVRVVERVPAVRWMGLESP